MTEKIIDRYNEKNYIIIKGAKVHNLKVVTYESGRGNNTIYRACELCDVPCIKFIDFLREEDLSYWFLIIIFSN